MRNDDGIVKKTRKTLQDKVVPAAREGLEKGSTYASGLLKDTGKIAGHLVEVAGEKTREAGKSLGERSEKILPDKNDAFRHFKNEADHLARKTVKMKDQAAKEAADKSDAAMDFIKNKKDRAEKETSRAVRKADKMLHPNRGRKKVVRTAAGVVVLAAAAAGAYAYYKKRKEEDEAIKAEFSEKMKKWNELEGEALAQAKEEHPVKMNIRPTRVYYLNKNALLGEDIILNVNQAGEGMAEFNPDEVAEPVNTVEELRKKAGEIAEKTGEKAKEVGEKAKEVAGKAGEKAKVVADKTREKASEVAEKTREKASEVADKTKEKASEVADKTKEKASEVADKTKEKAGDAKEKASEVADKTKEKASEVADKTKEKAQEVSSRKDAHEGFGAKDTPHFRTDATEVWQPVEGLSKEAKDKNDLNVEKTEETWRLEEEMNEESRHAEDAGKQNQGWLDDENIGEGSKDGGASWEKEMNAEDMAQKNGNQTREADENWSLETALDDQPSHPDLNDKETGGRNQTGVENDGPNSDDPRGHDKEGSGDRVPGGINNEGKDTRFQSGDTAYTGEDPEDLQENKMETDDRDNTLHDNLTEKEDDIEMDYGEGDMMMPEDPSSLGENLSWEDDESMIMQRTKEIRRKGSKGYRMVKEKVMDAKEFVEDKYHEIKPEKDETETTADFFEEEFQVTIHNRGNKDYFFSPMLIQRYNTQKRCTCPVPAHEEGTTLEQRIIKPGETYSGTIVLRMTDNDDALIMFEDMLMKNSVAILLDEDLDSQFLQDESRDLHDDLLFEGIEGDLEDYEFADEDMTQLDDLDIEETEEIEFDLSDEKNKDL